MTSPSFTQRLSPAALGPPSLPVDRPPPRLIARLREQIRCLRYSIRTAEVCVHWVRAQVRFHAMRHLRAMGWQEVQAFPSLLANARQVAVSTHRQALAPMRFLLDRQVFGLSPPWLGAIGRRQRKARPCQASPPVAVVYPAPA